MPSTDVAGSIAGNANLAPSLSSSGASSEGRSMLHNGAAPHAKLIVDDFSDDDSTSDCGLCGIPGGSG